MSPEFAAAVDPIFIHVVELLERIRCSRSESVQIERDRIDLCFQKAEAALGERPDWLLAKYALVAWIDETLKAAPWDGAQWWIANSLEFAYFNTGEAAVEFYKKAQDATRLPRRDALEVFYVCVVLGFRGLFELDEREFLASHLKLPPDVESWAHQTAQSVSLGQGMPRIQDASQPIRGAPPLTGRFQLVAATVTLFVLLVGLALSYIIIYVLK